jgi:hypothetical protein
MTKERDWVEAAAVVLEDATADLNTLPMTTP